MGISLKKECQQIESLTTNLFLSFSFRDLSVFCIFWKIKISASSQVFNWRNFRNPGMLLYLGFAPPYARSKCSVSNFNLIKSSQINLQNLPKGSLSIEWQLVEQRDSTKRGLREYLPFTNCSFHFSTFCSIFYQNPRNKRG